MAYIGHMNKAKDFTLDSDPIGWAKAGDPLTFVHEFGHILGCNHDREEMMHGGKMKMSNYGYIMRGSATDKKSGMITIMARLQSGYVNLTCKQFCSVPTKQDSGDSAGL